MSDIVNRLRGLADLFEAQHAPHNLVLHMRAGADEIERLRAGGCARDQGTTQYCAEAAKKDAEITSLTAEVERLRAVLEHLRAELNEHGGRYWEARYRDEASDNERLRAALAEAGCDHCRHWFDRAALEGK